MEANNVEKRFNDWFTVSYDRLRNLVGRYGTLDEDNFHDTYLFVRKQVLNPEREITDYEAYFISVTGKPSWPSSGWKANMPIRMNISFFDVGKMRIFFLRMT